MDSERLGDEKKTTAADVDESGPIRSFLTRDHQRLADLLEIADSSLGTPEGLKAYDEFRRGLLRHIGMEEKTLFPAAQRLRGGEPLAEAATLRLEHGAIVALLMPEPSPGVFRALRAIFAIHNLREEGPDGVYALCEDLALAAGEVGELLRQLEAQPQVPTNPNVTSPRVLEAARRALARAGYDPGLMDA